MTEHPPVSLTHRNHPLCKLADHVAPIGFDKDEPTFEYHGESSLPDAVDEQCMCGHVPYLSCPDYLSVWIVSDACRNKAHSDCDRSAVNDYMKQTESDMCPCECHALPFPAALAEQNQSQAVTAPSA